jgi:Mor family transcriptional regulator
MNYENANNILPSDIVELIQEYIDGKYLYIPRKSENKKSWGEESGFREELESRNKEIIGEYNKGKTVKEISKDYYLTEHSIRRIIKIYNK